jgi:hypothetical protein
VERGSDLSQQTDLEPPVYEFISQQNVLTFQKHATVILSIFCNFFPLTYANQFCISTAYNVLSCKCVASNNVDRLCGLVVRVPGYITEMYCVYCEERTEYIYIYIYICYVEERPPLWSSGQSFWLQMQRSGFDSRRYQIFWEIEGLVRCPLSLVSTTEKLRDRKVAAPV